MIQVFIADDHTIVRQGLKQLFSFVPDIEVIGEADGLTSTLQSLALWKPDLLLLDLTMPGIDGDDMLKRLRAHHARLPILVLSMHDDPQIARRALKAGANGYLTKGRDVEALLMAIRKVAAGGYYVDPEIAQKIVLGASGAIPVPTHDALSDRELQVFRLLATGYGINEIAERLSISNKTVSTHKSRLMEKMGFSSNVELIRYAVANNVNSA